MTELRMQLKVFLLWTLLLVPPFALTALNLWNLFAECSGRRKLAPRLFAGLSIYRSEKIKYRISTCYSFAVL